MTRLADLSGPDLEAELHRRAKQRVEVSRRRRMGLPDRDDEPPLPVEPDDEDGGGP